MEHAEQHRSDPDGESQKQAGIEVAALGRVAMGSQDVAVGSDGASDEGETARVSYIDEVAQRFADTGATPRDRERRFELRKAALLAKQKVIVNDQRAIRAARARQQSTGQA